MVQNPVRLAAAAVEIERQGQDRMALARALAHRALGADPPGPEASIWLTEAANLAEEAGDIDLAIDYWLAANDLSPGSASASIGLAEAQYRKRGAGSKAEAAATMEVLKNVDGELTEEELERLSFLRAEALKVPLYIHPTRPPQPVVDASYTGNFSAEVTTRLPITVALRGE